MIGLSVPPGTVAIPLDADESERQTGAKALLANLPAGHEFAGDRAAETAIADLGGTLRDSGITYAAVLSKPGETPEKCAMLIVAYSELNRSAGSNDGRGAAVDAIRSICAVKHPQAQVDVVPLANGRAVRVLRGQKVAVPPSITSLDDTVEAESRSVQYLVPSPEASSLITIEVTTGSVDLWPYFSEQAAQIAGRIKFGGQALQPRTLNL
ncbi:hypothetical protein IEU95_10225 [Hoyosella rhizosphaerae]|uniref:Uncharacterized protein n=1 Tax=Hoyosella rhizosphaerae TaxID=1755582 RepID=A0A916TZJ9_9ACTN|nr:hypothetical protein [Hoyosella rhizosphaerae]MBN4927211.1 hypothetical protein [Hoyosella rhizosphaerae]GGC53114.1 hypothetical protein GCM10011410_01830 [Hoyosella rhizosphaerae]